MHSTFTKLVVQCSKTCIFYRNVQTIVELQLWNVSAFKEEAHRTMRSIHKGLRRVGFVVVHWLSCVWLFVTQWTGACQAFLSFTISRSLLKFMSTESVMPSNHFILSHSLRLLPSLFPASGSFPGSWLYPSGGQSIGASALASVLPANIQGLVPLELINLTSL